MTEAARGVVTWHCKRHSCRACLGELVTFHGRPAVRIGAVLFCARVVYYCHRCQTRGQWRPPPKVDCTAGG